MAGLALAAASPLTFTTRGVPPRALPAALHALAEQGLVPIMPLPDMSVLRDPVGRTQRW